MFDCEFDGDHEVVEEGFVPFDFSCFLLKELASLRRDIGYNEMWANSARVGVMGAGDAMRTSVLDAIRASPSC